MVEYLLPTSFVEETLCGTSVDSVIVDDNIIVKEFVEYHTPSSFLLSTGGVFISHRGVANHKDFQRTLRSKCRKQHYKEE